MFWLGLSKLTFTNIAHILTKYYVDANNSSQLQVLFAEFFNEGESRTSK